MYSVAKGFEATLPMEPQEHDLEGCQKSLEASMWILSVNCNSLPSHILSNFSIALHLPGATSHFYQWLVISGMKAHPDTAKP